jgi:hypothetical protein
MSCKRRYLSGGDHRWFKRSIREKWPVTRHYKKCDDDDDDDKSLAFQATTILAQSIFKITST